MRRILTVVTLDGTEHDIELTAPEIAVMQELAELFGRRWPWRGMEESDTPVTCYTPQDDPGFDLPMLYVGDTALPALIPLARSPLRDGVRVSLGTPLPDGAVQGSAELRVVAGEDAGEVVHLTAESVGRTKSLDTDSLIELFGAGSRPRRPLLVLPGAGLSHAPPPSPEHDQWWDGSARDAADRRVGWRRRGSAEAAPLPAGEGGTLLFARPPRVLPQARADSPEAPARVRWWHGSDARLMRLREHGRLLRARVVAINAAWTPLALSGESLADLRLAGKVVPDIAALLARAYPEPADVKMTAVLHGRRLWERRRADPDFLALRSGLRTVAPASPGFRLPAAGGLVPLAEHAFPAVVSLPEHGVIGVVGAGDRPRRLAGWLALQTAVHHCPEDVVLRVLTDARGALDWRWLRWLPRSSSALDDGDAPRVHADPTSVAEQIGELLLLLADRQRGAAAAAAEPPAAASPGAEPAPPAPPAGVSEGAAADGPPGPAVVLILDGIRRLRALPGVARLVQEGPAVGMYVVCLGTEARHLPPGCGWSLDTEADGGPQVVEGSVRYPVMADLPRGGWFEAPARALAPLRDAATVQRALDLADRPLPELLGLDSPEDPGPIVARWSAVPRSTTAVVGQADGFPFEVDLRRHGPHALVAGAGGSGRTAFLRTWVTSLAVANRPDEMIFVLVDYKGGTAFGSVAELPHVTSLIADLDTRQAERILGRLQAALRSRETQLSTYAARDIDHYHHLRDRDRDLPPLPRLVFVIAEFTGLVRELPDLVTGLLNIAQRGRSLGVHLVLATQRPGGLLPSVIQSTTNLRIALRVSGAHESVAVIDAPDAAAIPRSNPGRAFLRSGADELREFQAAMPVEPDRPHPLDLKVTMRELDRPAPPRNQPAHAAPSGGRGGAGPTDLDQLVSAVRTAARHIGLPSVPGPLPDQLPLVVTLSELPAPEGPVRDPAPVAYGVMEFADEPGRQPALFDLAADGPLAAIGAPRSGKSQLLRTIAAALAVRHSAADVHLFGIDSGNGALQALSGLPHCGAVVTRGRPDHMARLVGRLTAALYSRQQLFAEGGFSDIAAQRQAVPEERRLPYLVLLLDRWEAFAEFAQHDGGRMADDLDLLSSQGPAAGIQLVLTAETMLEAFATRAGLQVQDALVFNQRARDDYPGWGVEVPAAPLEPGRAFQAFSPVELQIALLDGEPTGRGQSDALDRLAAELRTREAHVPHARRPFTIDDAPRAAEKFHVGPGKGRPVGREDVLAWLRDRHATGASAALLGPRRAGKSWVLEELRRRLAAEGGRREIHRLTVPPSKSEVADDPDALAGLLDRWVRDAGNPAEALLDKAAESAAGSRLVFLLDEVGRLTDYGPAAVSWLRDLGQAGAWLVYTGTEKDWRTVVRWALTAPGSSFGNDVNARLLGPLDRDAALDFLSGTAANLGVALGRDTTAAAVVAAVGSWPYYLQVVGDALVRAVQGNDLSALSSADALRALIGARLLDECSLHFQSRWAEIGPAGRAALLTAPGTMPRDATPAQREDLREVGLLRPGEEWLDDPPLLDWIARNDISLRDGELPV
ncbi:FtsK/SpoIIIE domain-containing protein [Streptomyces sp. NBC_01198]|uniref:FtsK/SpoIIIE domain-containing protein n=1 Tax=Streptomyces sp. NBC_01198 TaxID=2903769 RepID=UPI002E16567F|nr:FtsK/SpoIIIE domain-containing protein [Streptomyces sp. NBC_01198]